MKAKRLPIPSSVLLIAVIGLVASAAGCTELMGPRTWIEYSEAVELSAANLNALDAKTSNGSVKVLASEDGSESIKVRVRVKAGGLDHQDAQACLDAIEIFMPVDDAHGVQEIFWDYTGGHRSHWQTEISYEIEMPAHLALRTKTSNGEIRVRGIASDCDAETSNGAVRVDGGAGRIKARTSNGRIEVRSAAEEVELRTSNGVIVAELTADRDIQGEIRTSNGHISVALDKEVSTYVKARTSNGRIRAALPLSDMDRSRRGREVEGYLGSGGEELEFRSSNGGIDLMTLAESDLEIDFDMNFNIDIDGDVGPSSPDPVGSTEDIDALPIGIPVEQELETTTTVIID